MNKKLTTRQDKFFIEYNKDFNASAAAVRAGYSSNGAKVTGHRLLTNPNLQQRREAVANLGIDTLVEIAQDGTNEMARVFSARTLLEYSIGKPAPSKMYEKPVSVIIKRVTL
jgi:phage terminase small subunit